MIGGICAGLADYMDVDISLIRLVFVAICFLSGIFPMVFFYLIAWAIVPVEIKTAGTKPSTKKE